MTDIHKIQAFQLLDNCRGVDLSEAVGSVILERVIDNSSCITDREFQDAAELQLDDSTLTVRAIHQLTAAVIELTQVIAMKS